jgi:ABC-2 type transport system permease protein
VKRVLRFILAARLSYIALFTWLNPYGYVSTRLLAPIALALVFGSVQLSEGGDASRAVVGGSLLAVVVSLIYGVTLGVANERNFGTLAVRATTPSGVRGDLVAKAMPHLLDGYVGGTLTIAVTSATLGVAFPAAAVGPMLLAAGAASVSGAGLALLVASVSLWSRDTFTAPNIAEMLITLMSGVFVDPSSLPAGIGLLSPIFPASAAVEVGVQAVTNGVVNLALLLREAALGGLYGAIGLASVAHFSRLAQRGGTHDLT